MLFLVETVNGLMNRLFLFLLWPFRSLDPVWPLLAISFLSGLLMLWIFARVSNQEAIRRSKDRIRGNLLGVRLYRHDVTVVLGLQRQILRETLRYMKHSLLPVLVLLPPILLILVQMNLFFGLKPLRVGERTILTARLSKNSEPRAELALRSEEGITVETVPVRVVSLGEISWRIRADEPGRHQLKVEVDGAQAAKEMVVGDHWDAVSSLRTADWLDLFLYSGEPSLPREGPLTAIEVKHSGQSLNVLGLETDWLVFFFVVSILAAFLFKGFLGVEL